MMTDIISTLAAKETAGRSFSFTAGAACTIKRLDLFVDLVDSLAWGLGISKE